MRAAGFDEHGESFVAQRFHERQRIRLQQGLATGELDQRHFMSTHALGRRSGQTTNFRQHFRQRLFFALREGIRGVAIGAAQVARRQPYENAGQTGKGAFALQAQIDFVDDECFRHFVQSNGWRGIGE